MNQAELIATVSEEARCYYDPGVSKIVTEAVIRALGDVAKRELVKGGDVTLPGIGKLHVIDVEARKGRNPSNGEAITIAAHKSPKFKAAQALKDAVNS